MDYEVYSQGLFENKRNLKNISYLFIFPACILFDVFTDNVDKLLYACSTSWCIQSWYSHLCTQCWHSPNPAPHVLPAGVLNPYIHLVPLCLDYQLVYSLLTFFLFLSACTTSWSTQPWHSSCSSLPVPPAGVLTTDIHLVSLCLNYQLEYSLLTFFLFLSACTTSWCTHYWHSPRASLPVLPAGVLIPDIHLVSLCL